MAGKSDIRAGGAFVELFTKDSQLVKGLKSAQKRLQSFGKSVLAVGGFFTGLGAMIKAPFTAAIYMWAQSGNEIQKMSQRTGLAAGNLAELSYAAEQSGTDMEAVEKALKGMAKHGFKIANFDAIAASIAAIPDPSVRAARAMEVFGKSGMAILPMIANLKALRAEAQRRGIISSDETFRQAEKMQSAFLNIRRMVTSVWSGIGAAVAPALVPALTAIDNILIAVRKWVVKNGELIRTVAVVGTALVAVGGVIAAVGAGIFALGTAAGIAATVLTTIGAVVGAIVSPIGLITIGLAAAGFAFFRFTEIGRSTAASIAAFFMPLVQTVMTTVGGIADALRAGDLALAASIGMAGVRVAFEYSKLQILIGWEELKLSIMRMLDEVAVYFAPKVAYISSLWGSLAAYVGSMFGVMTAAASPFLTYLQNSGAIVVLGLTTLFEKLSAIVKMFFAAVGIGFKAAVAQAAAIAKIAAPIVNAAGYDKTGFDVLDTINRAQKAADAAAEQARNEAAGRQGQRRAGADDRINAQRGRFGDAQAELDRLREQALAARKKAEKGAGGPNIKPPDAMPTASTTVTFSGAALMAAGQGGGGVQDMARDIKKQVLIQRNQEKHLARIAEKEAAVAS